MPILWKLALSVTVRRAAVLAGLAVVVTAALSGHLPNLLDGALADGFGWGRVPSENVAGFGWGSPQP